MVNLEKRIEAFVQLGVFLERQLQEEGNDNTAFGEIRLHAEAKNPWFTKASVFTAVKGIVAMLQKAGIEQWLAAYPFLLQERKPKRIAVIMAGNIPMVGFHDTMTVLLSGNKLLGKLSSKDEVLLPWLLKQLCSIEPGFNDFIAFEPNIMKDFDAVIATGSNNSSRYFDYYFKKYPTIIRKNRVSVAVLTGNESASDLDGLAQDMFSYFGLGCRNVSKLFVPEEFDMVKFISHFDSYVELRNHNKYLNNYEYNKSIYLLNQDHHYDNGYLLFREEENLFSPIAVVYFEKYREIRNLVDWFERNKHNIQCIVTSSDLLNSKTIEFGKSQMPNICDYADDVDTMSFLETLN
jgi:hypothetical protein